ncbi:hypothetical protein C0995_015173 [Termitomyces sp. Mi166|nr:hypothetical protein C0995_015173 [Termitomyces sp. Mi166\
MILSTLTLLACLLVPLAAAAASTSSRNALILANVRVEWTNSTIFDGYVLTSGHDVEPASGGKHFCDGTNGKQHPTRVPVATAALDDASVIGNFQWEGDWYTDFQDYFVTRIAGLPEKVDPNTTSWILYLNYVPAQVGGCQLQIKQHDEVLFAFYPHQYPFQAALYLSGPQEVSANVSNPFRVTNGTNGPPIAGASVGGKMTNADGYVSLEFSETGVRRLEAEKSGWAHVLLAPYTKVEESFNLHATHDVLSYGISKHALQNYDHKIFPGAVPRTFIGSILLAWSSIPLIFVENMGGSLDKLDLQIMSELWSLSINRVSQLTVRLTLATANALSLCLIRRAVSRRFGPFDSVYFTLLSITQFHLPFWMGRTLPNMFALIPVNIAVSFLLDKAPKSFRPSSNAIATAIAILTFTAVVLRAEILLLLGPIAFFSLFYRYITLKKVIAVGLISGLASLVTKRTALTVSVDSYFWGKSYLWPEFSGIYFNVYEGKSAEWGTSPTHAYWTLHLPKLLLSSFPLSIIGFFQDLRIRRLLYPFLVFIGLLSFLGHKEWRFIVYVVPVFNIAAALGLRNLSALSNRSNLFLLSVLIFFIGVNISLTYILTLTSINNYPGGTALTLFHQLYPVSQHPSAHMHVHISNLAAQTGASLFLQSNAPPFPDHLRIPTVNSSAHVLNPPWIYDKTEHLTISALTRQKSITHMIVEERPDEEVKKRWEVVGSVASFDKWVVDLGLFKEFGRVQEKEKIKESGVRERVLGVLRMVKKEKLWILQRKS